MLALWPIAFGLLLSFIDCGVMSTLKMMSTGDIPIHWKTLLPPVLVYATTPLIFLYSLKSETMTVMNLIWDVVSSILVSGIGIYYFKEKLSNTKLLGVLTSLISIYLLTYEP